MGRVDVHPVTPDRWADLADLFGANGAIAGCWCMWWRETAREFQENGNHGNRAALASLVAAGREPGLLAYGEGRPVGWVSVAPRSEYGRIERSPTLGPIDERPVWAVTCFYIRRGARRSGLTRALLDAAVAHVHARGADVVEGYPVDTAGAKRGSADLFTGVLSTFLDAGFVEVARRSPKRPIVRRELS